MHKKISKYLSIIILVSWIVLIFILSSQSYKEQSIQPALHRTVTANEFKEVLPSITFNYHHTPYSSRRNPYQFIEFLFRKGAHLFMYGMLAALAAAALKIRSNFARKWPIPILIVVFIASLDELNQRIRPGRTSNPQDVLVDLTGGCIGLIVYLVLSRLNERYKFSRS